MKITYKNNPQNFDANYSSTLKYTLRNKYLSYPDKMKEITAFENKIKNVGPEGSVLGIYKRYKPEGCESLTISLYKEKGSAKKSTIAIRGNEIDEYVDIDTGEIDYIKLFKEYLNFLKLKKLEKGLNNNKI